MGIFGWSLPPGCNGTPYDEEQAVEIDNQWPDQCESIFWLESGRIIGQRKDGTNFTIAEEFEGEEEDARQFVLEFFTGIEKAIERIENDLIEANLLRDTPIQSWPEFWASMAEFIPAVVTGQPFELGEEADSDTFPIFDGESWSPCAYKLLYGRDEDGLYIRVVAWDGDCSWDDLDEVREGCSADEFSAFQMNYMVTDPYFNAWADYCLWCARHGAVDPVKTYFRPKTVTHDFLLKDARENLRYLSMRVKK